MTNAKMELPLGGRRGFLAITLAAVAIASVLGQLVNSQERRAKLLRATGEPYTLSHDGQERVYRLHVPDGIADEGEVPLLFVLHGGGGTAKQASRMGFSELADREKIIVVYPEASGGNWNDGRAGEVIAEGVGENDDVGFVMALIGELGKEFKIDEGRIYATGFSNGAMMSHRLAIEHAGVFAAIAPAIGGIARELAGDEGFKPSEPVSVMVIQGTEDPLVPYDGGKVGGKGIPALGIRAKDRGEVVSTDEALRLWREVNGIAGEAKLTELPDNDPDDECRLERYDYPEGKGGVKLVLVKMVGAGHTIPGGVQYLPEGIIGKTCGDVDAVELIWDFFKGIRKPEG